MLVQHREPWLVFTIQFSFISKKVLSLTLTSIIKLKTKRKLVQTLYVQNRSEITPYQAELNQKYGEFKSMEQKFYKNKIETQTEA